MSLSHSRRDPSMQLACLNKFKGGSRRDAFQKEGHPGQASQLAALDRLEFQHLLASRQIPVHYDVADFVEDLETLRELGRR